MTKSSKSIANEDVLEGLLPVASPAEDTAHARASICAEICEKIAAGEVLTSICKSDDRFPSRTVFYKWMDADPALEKAYSDAVKLRVDRYVEETFAIADDGSNDYMEMRNKDGEITGYTINGEWVQRSKLRISTRQWYAEKIGRRIYGNAVTHSGDPENPVRILSASLTPDEMYAKMINREGVLG